MRSHALGLILALISSPALAYCPPGDFGCQLQQDADRRQAEMRYTAQQADQWRYQAQQQVQSYQQQSNQWRQGVQQNLAPSYGPSYSAPLGTPYRPY